MSVQGEGSFEGSEKEERKQLSADDANETSVDGQVDEAQGTTARPPGSTKVDLSATLSDTDDGGNVEDTDDPSDDEDEDGEEYETEEEIPLLKYNRLFGSLPRRSTNNASNGRGKSSRQSTSPQLSVECTAAVMGKVFLNSQSTPTSTSLSAGATSSAAGNEAGSVATDPTAPQSSFPQENSSAVDGVSVEVAAASTNLWRRESIPIVALGFQDGSVYLLDAVTATAIATPDQLRVRTDRQQHPIVSLSLDSSGTQLAAVDLGGMCTVFSDLKYSIRLQNQSYAPSTANTNSAGGSSGGSSSRVSNNNSSRQGQGGTFQSILSAFTGGGGGTSGSYANQGDSEEASGSDSQEERAPGGDNVIGDDDRLVPTLVLASVGSTAQSSTGVQAQRISYPKSFGRPTCMAIDPAYWRRREKAFLVGFDDGRLVMTKRGIIFQRRNDSVIYQGVKGDDKDFHGIEAISWRGSFVAWADCSGIRLLDSDTMTRIAHIDRPTGARPSLYPTISQLRPTLTFETSHRLLVAWGDCLLGLSINELNPGRTQTEDTPRDTESSSRDAGTAATTASAVRRLSVECTMAWELDGVACGVVPLDRNYCTVLSLVPPSASEDTSEPARTTNDVELQVVSRSTGEVLYADLLPIIRPQQNKGILRTGRVPEPAAPLHLLSSFSVPRMDDVSEYQCWGDDLENRSSQSGSVFGFAQSRNGFVDPHIKWDLEYVSFQDEIRHRVPNERVDSDDDGNSVDSDDYGLIFEPLPSFEADKASAGRSASPPVFLIAGSRDTVLARVRDVDDAISAALEERKAGLALRRGLCYLRYLRQYDIRDLINSYLRAVLRLETFSSTEEGSTRHVDVSGKNSSQLSLRRMKLAAEAMPILLGGDVDMWETWISELAKIPGALFITRNIIPVRDPILPQQAYARALDVMLDQIDEMGRSSVSDPAIQGLAVEAEDHFLNTLLAWGTTSVLKEYIKLYQCPGASSVSRRMLEEALSRRLEQSSSCYLRFSRKQAGRSDASSADSQVVSQSEKRDSLFDFNTVLSSKLQSLSIGLPSSPVSRNLADGAFNSSDRRVAFDAAAKLNMMKGEFDEALRNYLQLGLHCPVKAWGEIENDAVDAVNSNQPRTDSQPAKYSYVLSIIESHHLQECLLNGDFLSSEDSFPPLFALVRLVGIGSLGDFLIEHCVAPQSVEPARQSLTSRGAGTSLLYDKTVGERRGTLPIDLVADQLEGSPKLLYWYLHVVFSRKPSVYVRFPNTTNPPPAITGLHRTNIGLYIRYAGANKDSAAVLSGVEAYRVSEVCTPLLSFIKAVLPLGGIKHTELTKIIEVARKGRESGSFALELAYILEHYGEIQKDSARVILDLYLSGCKNLMLAVSFAQRTRQFLPVLWEILIDHCLSTGGKESDKEGSSGRQSVDGARFGSLLEAAALSGADLARLVSQIPPGMAVEGLRPRLVGAVSDYRLKLQMRQNAAVIANAEKVSLLCEVAHRSRRGLRFWKADDCCNLPPVTAIKKITPTDESGRTQADHRDLRPVKRHDRVKLRYSLPLR